MNEQEQRIALCEWMGWRDIEMRPHPLEGCDSVLSGRFGIKDYVLALPDTNSLDVLHEMEMKLGTGQRTRYIFTLQTMMGGQQFGDNYFATAAQRREALLKTLGLWKD